MDAGVSSVRINEMPALMPQLENPCQTLLFCMETLHLPSGLLIGKLLPECMQVRHDRDWQLLLKIKQSA